MNTKPYVKQLVLCRNHDYFTLVKDCVCRNCFAYTRYAVFGTDYGYLRTTSGNIRLWQSYSGAYKAMKKYIKSREISSEKS